MEKGRLVHYDLLRVLCAVGIICFHYMVAIKGNKIQPVDMFANGGSWGRVFTAIFFAISGSVLYMRYQGDFSICEYLWKRFKSIYPMFWLIFIHYFVQKAISAGYFFYDSTKENWTLILSIIGFDGYLHGTIPNYYMIGEWFIAPIVIMYLLYPLLKRLIDKFPVFIFITVIVVFMLFRNTAIINTNPDWNIFSCIISFVFGIYVVKYKLLEKVRLCLISVCIKIC